MNKESIHQVPSIILHLNESPNCAVISPWVDHCTDEENKRRMARLKTDVRKHGFGFTEFIFRWKVGDQQEEKRFVMIPKIEKSAAIRLGADYEQKSVLWWNGVDFEELCSLVIEGFLCLDILQRFEITKDQITVEQVKDVLCQWIKRITFSSRPTAELFEVEQPRPSYFQIKERILHTF